MTGSLHDMAIKRRKITPKKAPRASDALAAAAAPDLSTALKALREIEASANQIEVDLDRAVESVEDEASQDVLESMEVIDRVVSLLGKLRKRFNDRVVKKHDEGKGEVRTAPGRLVLTFKPSSRTSISWKEVAFDREKKLCDIKAGFLNGWLNGETVLKLLESHPEKFDGPGFEAALKKDVAAKTTYSADIKSSI